MCSIWKMNIGSFLILPISNNIGQVLCNIEYCPIRQFYFSTLILPSATSEGLEESMLRPAELVYTCFPQGLLHSPPLAL